MNLKSAALVLVVISLLMPPMTSVITAVITGEENWESVEFETNGLKVIYKRSEGETSSVALFFKGGVRNINEHNQGIEPFLLTLATRGSKNYPKDILSSELARMGTSIGTSAERDYSVISFRSIDQYFEESWSIFVDLILNPTLDEGEAELVREQLISWAKQARDNPDVWIWRIAGESFFSGHPYALEPEGTPTSLAGLSVQDLKEYHQEQLMTSKLMLVVVGDKPPSELKKMIGASFGDLPEGNYEETVLPKIKSHPELNSEGRNLPTNYVVGYWTAPNLKSEDYYPMLVATEILKYHFWWEVKEEQTLAYEVYASLSSDSSNWGTLYVCTTEPNEAVELMLREIERLKQEEVRPLELEYIVYLFITDYCLGQESAQAQALRLGHLELVGNGWETGAEEIEKIKEVTPQDIKRVTNQWIESISFGTLGPKGIDRRLFLQTGEKAVPSFTDWLREKFCSAACMRGCKLV